MKGTMKKENELGGSTNNRKYNSSSSSKSELKDNVGQGELYSPAYAIPVDKTNQPPLPEVMIKVKHKVLEKLVVGKASQLLDSVVRDAAAALSSPSPSLEEALKFTKMCLIDHNDVAKIVNAAVQELVTEQQQMRNTSIEKGDHGTHQKPKL